MGLLGDSGESTGDPPGAPSEPQGPCGAPPCHHKAPGPTTTFIYLFAYICVAEEGILTHAEAADLLVTRKGTGP